MSPRQAPGLLCCLSPPCALLLGEAAAGKGPWRRSRNGSAGAPNYLGSEVSCSLECWGGG